MAERIILDSNLALLLAVGTANRDYIASHKRLQVFDEVDFDNLCEVIAHSSGVIFTPNTLTETSNLVRYARDPIRSDSAAVLARFIENGTEDFVASKLAVARNEYKSLGLTDSVLLEVASVQRRLLTVDLDLYLAAVRAELKATNFNHIKAQRLDYQ